MITTNKLKNFAKDTSGQFSILFAVAASVLTMGAAASLDSTNLQKTRIKLNDIADAAALAGAAASEMNNTQRVKVVEDFIEANSGEGLMALLDGRPTISFDDTAKEVTVSMNIQADTMFSKVLGVKKKPVRTVSVATYGQSHVDPVSISFALDVSGSMGWPTSDGQIKINALKDSVALMFNEIESQIDDPSILNRKMRTGMSAYNTQIRARSRMMPGWRSVSGTINRMAAGGGTNSTSSLQNSYDQIMNDRAWRRTNDPEYNAAQLKEFVVFMTDGDNNRPEWDVSSSAVCDQMKADGIEVFTVAFAAPAKGQALLQGCASDDKDEHYFDAADAESFKEAFREIGKEIVERGIRIKS